MSREEMQRHREAGTCHLCEKPVLPGQAHNGATGAHWECCEKLDAEVTALMGERKLTHCVKGGGGWWHHWVYNDTHVALCGDAPKNTASRMKARGKWLVLKDQVSGEKTCQKCAAMKLLLEDF